VLIIEVKNNLIVRNIHPERCDYPGMYIPIHLPRWIHIQRDQVVFLFAMN